MERFEQKQNLVLCGNHEFIVKIDELKNNKIRYRCWRRPKTMMEVPDLILLNGQIEFKADKDAMEIVFPYGEWIYTVEKIKTPSTTHIFLEALKKNDVLKTWKMNDLSNSFIPWDNRPFGN